jgi:hypothetical protein
MRPFIASSFRAALPRLPTRERDLLSYRNESFLMKKIILIGMLALVASSIDAQSTAQNANDHQELDALLQQVQAQQRQIAENQANIDAKLASLAEAIRVARIYASRGGR